MKLSAGSAAELRDAFDRSFSEAHPESPVLFDVLAVQVAGRPYALRLADIAGLFVDRALRPLPSQQVGLIGVASFRAIVLPVFDLAALLGHSTAGATRWTIVAARGSCALAFDGLDGYLRLPREEIVPSGTTDPAHVVAVVRDRGVIRPLIALDTLLAALSAPLQETR